MKGQGSTWKLLLKGGKTDLQNTDATQCTVDTAEYEFLITITFHPTVGKSNDGLAHATLSFTVTDPPT